VCPGAAVCPASPPLPPPPPASWLRRRGPGSGDPSRRSESPPREFKGPLGPWPGVAEWPASRPRTAPGTRWAARDQHAWRPGRPGLPYQAGAGRPAHRQHTRAGRPGLSTRRPGPRIRCPGGSEWVREGGRRADRERSGGEGGRGFRFSAQFSRSRVSEPCGKLERQTSRSGRDRGAAAGPGTRGAGIPLPFSRHSSRPASSRRSRNDGPAWLRQTRPTSTCTPRPPRIPNRPKFRCGARMPRARCPASPEAPEAKGSSPVIVPGHTAHRARPGGASPRGTCNRMVDLMCGLGVSGEGWHAWRAVVRAGRI
jgi:hypothetical protein